MLSVVATTLFALSAAAPNYGVPDIKCCTSNPPSTPFVATATISVSFLNTYQTPVELCWANFQGTLTSYGTIQPSQQSAITTYVGHNWTIREPSYTPCTGKVISGVGSYTSPGTKDVQDLARTCPVPKVY